MLLGIKVALCDVAVVDVALFDTALFQYYTT